MYLPASMPLILKTTFLKQVFKKISTLELVFFWYEPRRTDFVATVTDPVMLAPIILKPLCVYITKGLYRLANRMLSSWVSTTLG